jgi:CRISPR-associated protein (Cas_Csd1)
MRLRADHDVNALRVAILKSILIKNFKMEVPVSLDPECKEPGYLLGRLFAVYEQIQIAALGRNVNATIKDKFYGSAGRAAPQGVPYAGIRFSKPPVEDRQAKARTQGQSGKSSRRDHGGNVPGR